jgi:hypothetical protein
MERKMNKALDELTTLIRSTKESVDGSLSLWLYKLAEDGDELTPFRVLVHETIRELCSTSVAGLEPLAIQHLSTLVRKLGEFAPMFAEEGISDRKIWEAVPERQKQIFHFCATELCTFVRVMNSGGTWRGVYEKMTDGSKRKNTELEKLQEVYLYFATNAGSVELADIDA